MSALLRLADISWRERKSALCQKRKSARSTDHLVGARKGCRRRLDAQCFCDAEIDPAVELGRSFERQVVRLRAF
jgi:hypothetical protein